MATKRQKETRMMAPNPRRFTAPLFIFITVTMMINHCAAAFTTRATLSNNQIHYNCRQLQHRQLRQLHNQPTQSPIKTSLSNKKDDLNASSNNEVKNHHQRRQFLQSAIKTTSTAAAVTAGALFSTQDPANAAPPMAVIAEELGYFPVTNKMGDTVYVPAKVKRQSTEQALDLAKYLQSSGAVMYGAYWCPHCSHQKEILGREAWSLISYSECSPKGFNSNAAICIAKEKVDGFPTWKLKNGKKVRSGEMTLVELAKWSGYRGKIDESLESDVPMSGMSGSCR